MFPNFEGSIYDVEGGPRLRNATVTTIAPTGTISIIAGCSSGIEPLFALGYVRRKVLDDDEMVEVYPYFEEVARREGFYSDELIKRVADEGSARHVDDVPAVWRKVFATAHDVTPEWHIKLQAAFQDATDNAVSKTVNFPNDATADDVDKVYRLAFRSGCKGVTIYRDGSRDEQVLNVGAAYKQGAPRDPAAGGIATTRPARPRLLSGETERMDTGCGKLFVIMNDDEHGPREVFANMGKAGGCASSNTEALGRLISLALKKGAVAERGRRPAQGHPLPRALRHGAQRHAVVRRRHRQGHRAALHRAAARAGRHARAAARARRGRPGRLPRLRRLHRTRRRLRGVPRSAATPSAAESPPGGAGRRGRRCGGVE